MTGKKPSLGRGLAELSPLMARSAAAVEPEARASRPAIGFGDICRSICCSEANISRAWTCVPRRLNELAAVDQGAGRRAAHRGAPPARPGRRPPNPGESQRYEIIAGERRWRAAQMAGLAEIPAIMRDVPDEAAVAMALIENIQREDLNPLEEARALTRLIEEFGLTHQAAAEAVGRSRAAVSNLLRLMELADEVKELLEQRSIEMGHARALLSLTSRRQQIEVAGLVAKKSLSVRDTEALVRRLHPSRGGRVPGEPAPDPDIHRLELELADKLGASVMFQHTSSGKGKLVVTYNSLDELEGILAHIT